MKMTRVTVNTSTVARPNSAYTAPLVKPSSRRMLAMEKSIQTLSKKSKRGKELQTVTHQDLPKKAPFAPAPHPSPLPKGAREQEDLATREVPPSSGIKGPALPARDAVSPPSAEGAPERGEAASAAQGGAHFTIGMFFLPLFSAM